MIVAEMLNRGGEVRYVVGGEDFEFVRNREAVVFVENHGADIRLLSIGGLEGIRERNRKLFEGGDGMMRTDEAWVPEGSEKVQRSGDVESRHDGETYG